MSGAKLSRKKSVKGRQPALETVVYGRDPRIRRLPGDMHPANAMLTCEIVAKTTLGIGLDENPRWG